MTALFCWQSKWLIGYLVGISFPWFCLSRDHASAAKSALIMRWLPPFPHSGQNFQLVLTPRSFWLHFPSLPPLIFCFFITLGMLPHFRLTIISTRRSHISYLPLPIFLYMCMFCIYLFVLLCLYCIACCLLVGYVYLYVFLHRLGSEASRHKHLRTCSRPYK